ncbi:glutamate [NMDA] receptor subunit 1-like [Homarus americanus]|uniref:glutamate [NMDA] receptor subunit 1-like n=1 Tax=Homarus americanus TaxID=6706 RepID=UPI001C4687F0|nr:glutamate [NMDA] receptor subunit 1-like [Homarus americanus]
MNTAVTAAVAIVAIGMTDAATGMTDADTGMTDAATGMTAAATGMTAAATGMTAAATGMTAAATGMTARAANSSLCLKVCAMIYLGHMFIDYTTTPYTVDGPMIEVLDIITTKLNTCYEFVFSDLPSPGYKLANGTWLGAMGLVSCHECEMVGAPFPMNHLRFEVVDFSIPMYIESYVIAFESPVLEADLAGFAKPFTGFIWLLILASIVAVVVGIFFIESGESFLLRQQQRYLSHVGCGSSHRGHWTSCLWTLGAAVSQASTWSPQRDSVRLLSGLWLLTSVILSLVYRCNLKAMLIMPKIQVPFNSLEELMETDIPVYIPEGTLAHEFVIVAPPGTLLHRVNERLIVHYDPPRAIQDTIDGKYAAITTNFVMAQIFHDIFSLTNSCPMYIASEPVFTGVSSGFAYPKGSPLKHAVDPILRRLVEFGILQHVFLSAIRNGTICLKPESFTRTNNSLRPLELEDFYGVFAVYAGGMVLASVVLLVEVALKGHQRIKGRPELKDRP